MPSLIGTLVRLDRVDEAIVIRADGAIRTIMMDPAAVAETGDTRAQAVYEQLRGDRVGESVTIRLNDSGQVIEVVEKSFATPESKALGIRKLGKETREATNTVEVTELFPDPEKKQTETKNMPNTDTIAAPTLGLGAAVRARSTGTDDVSTEVAKQTSKAASSGLQKPKNGLEAASLAKQKTPTRGLGAPPVETSVESASTATESEAEKPIEATADVEDNTVPLAAAEVIDTPETAVESVEDNVSQVPNSTEHTRTKALELAVACIEPIAAEIDNTETVTAKVFRLARRFEDYICTPPK